MWSHAYITLHLFIVCDPKVVPIFVVDEFGFPVTEYSGGVFSRSIVRPHKQLMYGVRSSVTSH
jgi:hypothetical protein